MGRASLAPWKYKYNATLPETNFPAMVNVETPPLKPNTVAFSLCIDAWASSNRGRKGVLRAQELLVRLEALSLSNELDLPSETISEDEEDALKPNVRAYSAIMSAWANVPRMEGGSSKDAASRCKKILDRMEERGASDSSVRPNLVVFITDVEHAASRAESILNRMVDLYYDEGATELPQLDGDVDGARHDAPFNAV